MAEPIQKTSHEGIRAYADAAHARNIIVSPFLFPKMFVGNHFQTASSIAVENMTDENLKQFLNPSEWGQNAAMKYIPKNQVNIFHAQIDFDKKALAGLTAATGVFGAIFIAANSKTTAPLPAEKLQEFTELAKPYCEDKVTDKITADIGEAVKSQTPQLQTEGLSITYTKSASEMTHAVQECASARVKSLTVTENLPLDFVASVSAVLMAVTFYASVLSARELYKDRKSLKQMSVQSEILKGDRAVAKAEAQKRGISESLSHGGLAL